MTSHQTLAETSPAPAAVRETIGPGLALYLTLIVVLVTLAPYDFHWPPIIRFSIPTAWNKDLTLDSVANILLFMPIGFTYRLCMDRSRSSGRSLLWAAFLTIGIELLQTMIPPRVASPIDVAMNWLGALLGVVFFDSTMSLLKRRQVEVLALELPLAGVFYLLIPILWLNALLVPMAPARIWLTIPVGVMGGLLLGSIGHHRLGPAGFLRPWGVVLLIGFWIALANAPFFVGKPRLQTAPAIAASSLTLALVLALVSAPTWAFGTSRRFETSTLWRLLPLLLLYLVGDALFPWQKLGEPWRFRLGFDQVRADNGPIPLLGVFAIIEHATSFVVLGFVFAGLRSRIADSRAQLLFAVGLLSALWLLVTETLRGFHPEFHFSVAHLILGITASILGAFLYRMHQKAVWRMLGRFPLGETDDAPRRSRPHVHFE